MQIVSFVSLAFKSTLFINSYSVVLRPDDEETCVTASDDNTIRIWRSGRKIRELNHNKNKVHFPKTTTTKQQLVLEEPNWLEDLLG
jgi:WD40 repeat protein